MDYSLTAINNEMSRKIIDSFPTLVLNLAQVN